MYVNRLHLIEKVPVILKCKSCSCSVIWHNVALLFQTAHYSAMGFNMVPLCNTPVHSRPLTVLGHKSEINILSDLQFVLTFVHELFIIIKLQFEKDCMASGIDPGSFFDHCTLKQHHTGRCTSLGPQQ